MPRKPLQYSLTDRVELTANVLLRMLEAQDEGEASAEAVLAARRSLCRALVNKANADFEDKEEG